MPSLQSIKVQEGAYCFDKWVALYRTKRATSLDNSMMKVLTLVKKGDESEHTKTLVWAIEKNLTKNLN